MYRLLITILVFVYVAGGCGGTNTAVLPPPPTATPTVGSDNLGDANTGRLMPTGDPGITGVGGQFLVQGFTVLDENQQAVNPGEGGIKFLGRLLDPGDDILSVVTPGASGTYELYATNAVTDAKVQLEFRVQEDVDGDGEGNDLIVHTVPVQLVPGFISIINMTVTPGSVHQLDEVFAAETETDFPGSSTVVIGVDRLDGNGEYSELFALFPNGKLYLDENNDEFFEPGVDSFWDDLDRNGWPDPEESSYEDAGANNWTYLEGKVLSVDIAAQTMFLFVEFAEVVDQDGVPLQAPGLVGKSIKITKLSYTVMEGMLLPSDPGMNESAAPEDIGFTDPFLIDESLVGRTVIVQGLYDGNIVEAELIFELSREPVPVAGGF